MWADVDGDQFSDWIEVIITGTDPTDAASFLQISGLSVPSAAVTGAVVRWSSATGKYYRLTRSTNLLVGFVATLKSNILATPPTNTATDTNVLGQGPWLYRVNVEE